MMMPFAPGHHPSSLSKKTTSSSGQTPFIGAYAFGEAQGFIQSSRARTSRRIFSTRRNLADIFFERRSPRQERKTNWTVLAWALHFSQNENAMSEKSLRTIQRALRFVRINTIILFR